MSRKTIAIASDHAGYDLKTTLSRELAEMGYEVLDLGTDGPQSVDYPDFGAALAKAVQAGEVERGVLVCGTGIGIAMAANRHPGVRAAVCWDETSARLTRAHNDANVLSISDRVLVIQLGRLIAATPVPELLARAQARGVGSEEVVLDIVRQARPAAQPAEPAG
jgi:ribose 5-phosphate isomerase B